MNDIQKKELEVFCEVLKILDRHKLRYFAIGGTCIGAVRHHGFIPWDDDIDIAMPRKDYELLRSQYYTELPDNYRKLDYAECASDTFLFTKIYDTQSTYIEDYAKNYPERYTGVFVDVMPVDGFSAIDNESEYALKKVDHMLHMNTVIRPWDYEARSVADTIKICLKKIYRKCIRIIRPFDYYSNKVEKYLQKFDFDHSENVLFTWRDECPIERRIFKKSMFEKTIEVKFEDIIIKIPKEFDKYLTQDFGNYMKLPPEKEQRSIHSVYVCDLNKPSSYYAELKRKGKMK